MIKIKDYIEICSFNPNYFIVSYVSSFSLLQLIKSKIDHFLATSGHPPGTRFRILESVASRTASKVCSVPHQRTPSANTADSAAFAR